MKHVTESPAEKVLEAALLDLIQANPELLKQLRSEYPGLTLGVGSRQGSLSLVAWLLGGTACLLAALGLGGVGVVGVVVALGFLVLAVLRRFASERQAGLDLYPLSLVGPGRRALTEQEGMAPNDDAGTLAVMGKAEAFGEAEVDLEVEVEAEEEPLPIRNTVPLRSAPPKSAPKSASVRQSPEPRRAQAMTPAGFQEEDDPLTEADFHIGYGMYDQAAELLEAAIERDPARRELRLKLLDVYFESGNRDAFVQLAHELLSSRYMAGSGEREKVAIMGRQIAPKSPLFAEGEDPGLVAGMGLDLDLESGQSQVDYDLMATAKGERAAAIADEFSGARSRPRAFASTGALAEDGRMPPDLGPVSMTEVATKLDLAHAYAEMGDLAGARSILEEVIVEGSLAQKEAAQQLLETLPS